MKKVFILLILIQGILMSATLKKIDINGTKVPIIFEENKNLPLISLQLIFINSGYLTDNKEGLVKLSTKLLNNGTKKDGSVSFANKLESKAINLSINCGAETFVIALDSLKEQFDYGIDRIKELLSDPNYTQDTLKKIKLKTIGELKRKESDFDYISSLNLKGLLFPNMPISKPPLGTQKSIESITLDDIKDAINRRLSVKNLIVVIGGDINMSKAQTVTKNIVSNLSNYQMPSIKYMKVNGNKEIKEIKVPSKQAYIHFGSPLDIRYDSNESYLAKVASYILGSGGFGSRLMEEIRVKKGLAYSVYSRFNINRTNSYFSGLLQTKLSSKNEAIDSVKEVIDKFIKYGVTQNELDSAKKFILGSEPLRTEVLSQRLYRAFNEYYLDRGIGATQKDLKKIESLSLEELNNFIKRHKEILNISFSIVTGKH